MIMGDLWSAKTKGQSLHAPLLMMKYLRELRHGANIILRITDTFDVNRLGLLIDGSSKILRFIGPDELDVDAKFWECN